MNVATEVLKQKLLEKITDLSEARLQEVVVGRTHEGDVAADRYRVPEITIINGKRGHERYCELSPIVSATVIALVKVGGPVERYGPCGIPHEKKIRV